MKQSQRKLTTEETLLGALVIIGLIIFLFDSEKANKFFKLNDNIEPKSDLDALSLDLGSLKLDSQSAKKRLMSEYEPA